MKRIAVNTIVLMRAGQRITVKPGQTVDLTQAEIDDINRVAPRALKKPTEQIVDEVKLPDAPKPQGGKQDKKDKSKDEKPAGDKPAGDDGDGL